jgi:hypothetical protein
MTIEGFRDLTIIIYGLMWAVVGLVGIILLIIVGIMAIALFRRLKIILDSLQVASSNIQEISTMAKEQIAKPIMQVGSVFQGITRWMEVIGEFFKKPRRN